MKVYGLKNCDTCRKALKWLDGEGAAYTFVDVRRDGVDSATLREWIDMVGWEVLLNKRGTTWRGLSDDEKEGIDPEKALSLLLANPALMKRPVFDLSGRVIVGFKAAEEQALQDKM